MKIRLCYSASTFKKQPRTHFYRSVFVTRNHQRICFSRLHCAIYTIALTTLTAVAGIGEGAFTSVCLFVCFPHDSSKTDAAKITKLGVQMLHDESETFILGSKCQRSKSPVTKNCRRGSLHSCECWLLLVIVQHCDAL